MKKRKPEKRCPQCGQTYRARPCGFAHAAIGGWTIRVQNWLKRLSTDGASGSPERAE